MNSMQQPPGGLGGEAARGHLRDLDSCKGVVRAKRRQPQNPPVAPRKVPVTLSLLHVK